jgi:hypothetical protein
VRHKQGILGARASPEPQKWPTTRELAFFKRKEEELHNHIPLKVFWISLGNSLEYLIGLHFIYCPYHYFFS